MRLKNLCVFIDITDGHFPKFRARSFCYMGKSEIVWGKTIYASAHLDRVRYAVEKFFHGKTHRVFIAYDASLDRPDEMLEYFELTSDCRWSPLDQPLQRPC
jgi:hypothetical protein